MKKYRHIKYFMIISLCSLLGACEDYVEVGVPDDRIVKETVFEDDETAIRAIRGIYNELFNASFSGGWRSSVTVLAGLSADLLQPVNSENITYGEIQKNEISPNHPSNYELWSSAYNIIYMTNSVLEGLAISKNVSDDLKRRLEGEARFVRAFTYFYLVNIYGEVPLILDTDYRNNSLVSRNGIDELYTQVVKDLDMAIELLDSRYESSDRTSVNIVVAVALRARVALYQENWDLAEILSSEIIERTATYEILQDLDEVFLANSKEAIWQISPIGRGNILTSTGEGQVFIGTSRSSLQLATGFVEDFEPEDKRLVNWVGHYNSNTRDFYFPFKYKDRSSLNDITEYSMVFRLAEQYLIRAEARVRKGKMNEAISDINVIRIRAGIEPIDMNEQEIDIEEILDLIMKERKKELFAEWGHRWFDLKRTGRTDEVLAEKTSFWEPTDVFYPIPEPDRMKNPNLDQNEGY
ncbi:RagB/SusD family nutrient uptake outer membrane protein [Salinimicrobium sp. TIG7-5_MAKvit]|uniref:RagB/SusD family nutrient uptake outer membrane protein n=1 Tax=Salinimicrobium sp. TIG7-5_MAKvit TaxID=3121289 RepID=UPI003C6E601C